MCNISLPLTCLQTADSIFPCSCTQLWHCFFLISTFTLGVTGHGFYSESCHCCEHSAHNTFRNFHFVQQFPRGTHHNMKIYSCKTRASCGQSTSGLQFQFEFHITVLCYMGCVSVKQFVTNGLCVFFSDVLTYCVILQAFICYCSYVSCL